MFSKFTFFQCILKLKFFILRVTCLFKPFLKIEIKGSTFPQSLQSRHSPLLRTLLCECVVHMCDISLVSRAAFINPPTPETFWVSDFHDYKKMFLPCDSREGNILYRRKVKNIFESVFFVGVSIQKRLRRRYFRRVINVLI